MIKPRHLLALLSLPVFASLTGCIDRTLTIASEPPGALVYINDVEVGRTSKEYPLKVPFTWYGEYDIRMRLERNEGTVDAPLIKRYYLHTSRKASAPWHQWLGVDLVTELSPLEFKDEKIWAFVLHPVVDPPGEDLVTRAKDLKARLGEAEALRDPKRQQAEDLARPSPASTTQPAAAP